MYKVSVCHVMRRMTCVSQKKHLASDGEDHGAPILAAFIENNLHAGGKPQAISRLFNQNAIVPQAMRPLM